jgi:hypothetical protein
MGPFEHRTSTVDRALRRAFVAAALLHAGAAAWAVRRPIYVAALDLSQPAPDASEAAPLIVELAADEPLEAPPATRSPPARASEPGAEPAQPTRGGALAIVPPQRAPIARSPSGPSGQSGPSEPELLTAPTGSTAFVSRAPTGVPSSAADRIARAPGAAPSSLEARLDAFDPNKRPAWMPSKIGTGAKPDDAPSAEKLAAKVSKDLAQGADDRARGAGGYGGPVVSAAHDASMGWRAPQTGYAVIAVDFDAKGIATRVTLVDASGDRPEWQQVADAVGKGLANKPVLVPPGAGGLRVTVKVQAKLAFPSGATDRVSGPSIGTDGTQATASVSFDLSDVGQKPRRIVGVVVLSETRL